MRRCLLFIPMYNCGPQIGRVLSQLQKDGVADHFEGVACIDNGSSDDTVEAAIRGLETVPISKRAVLVNRDNYNLGGSHKVAIAHALDHGYTHLTVLHGDDQGSVDDLVDNLPENGDARCRLPAWGTVHDRLTTRRLFAITDGSQSGIQRPVLDGGASSSVRSRVRPQHVPGRDLPGQLSHPFPG